MSTTTYVLKHKYEKYQNFLSENFHFFGGKIFSIFEQACFRNVYVKIIQEMLQSRSTALSRHQRKER